MGDPTGPGLPATISRGVPIAPALGITPRNRAIGAFLDEYGWGGLALVPLAADASFRSYYRLRAGGRSVVFMDAPPPQEDVGAYVAVSSLLRRLGFSAPAVFAEDRAQGFLLLEDFGDDTYTRLLGRGFDEPMLYTLAIDTLIALQRSVEIDDLRELPPYDSERLLAEAALLVDWYLPATLGAPLGKGLRDQFLALSQEVIRLAVLPGPTLMLRDYDIYTLLV